MDEDLPNFFKTIRLSEAREITEENENMQHNFGFVNTDPDTIEMLEREHKPERKMQGTPWYHVLCNDKYNDAFNYIGAYVNEREKLIQNEHDDEDMTEEQIRHKYEQSDMVVILMNLSYIPDSVI